MNEITNVRIVQDTADTRQVEITNINLSLGRMITLAFKAMLALIVVNAILALPVLLVIALLRALLG